MHLFLILPEKDASIVWGCFTSFRRMSLRQVTLPQVHLLGGFGLNHLVQLIHGWSRVLLAVEHDDPATSRVEPHQVYAGLLLEKGKNCWRLRCAQLKDNQIGLEGFQVFPDVEDVRVHSNRSRHLSACQADSYAVHQQRISQEHDKRSRLHLLLPSLQVLMSPL
jgi:hypothetical protein